MSDHIVDESKNTTRNEKEWYIINALLWVECDRIEVESWSKSYKRIEKHRIEKHRIFTIGVVKKVFKKEKFKGSIFSGFL